VKIYLIRHAKAIEADGLFPDEARFLTESGRDTAKRMGRALRKAGVVFDELLSSPLVRAVQTAELLAQGTEHKGVIEVVPSIGPGGPVGETVDLLLQRDHTMAVVGHAPSISVLGGLLTGDRSFPHMRKAQVVCLEDGRVLWSMDPDEREPVPVKSSAKSK